MARPLTCSAIIGRRNATGLRRKGNYNYAIAHGFLSAPVYYGLGRSCVELAKGQAALGPLQASPADPWTPALIDAHLQLSKAYDQPCRPKDARREKAQFEQMRAQSPDDVKALLKEGESLIHAGQMRPGSEFTRKRSGQNPERSKSFLRSGHGFFPSERLAEGDRKL